MCILNLWFEGILYVSSCDPQYDNCLPRRTHFADEEGSSARLRNPPESHKAEVRSARGPVSWPIGQCSFLNTTVLEVTGK